MTEIYTGFRLKCIVKPEFKPLIDGLFDYQNWKSFQFKRKMAAFPFVDEWSQIENCNDIPFANVDNFPHWERERWTEAIDDAWSHRFIYNTMEWRFQTCTKKKDSIIQFIVIVLNRIALSVQHCEIYPQNSQPNFYFFKG